MEKAKFKFNYKRTKSKAQLQVKFPNGEVWEVPVQVIADSRDENYACDEEDTIGFIRRGSLSNYELMDWAANNMNWEDLAPHAKKVADPPPADPQEQWNEAELDVVGKA